MLPSTVIGGLSVKVGRGGNVAAGADVALEEAGALVGIAVSVAVAVAVGRTGGGATQAVISMVLVSSVTAPVRAKARPGMIVAVVFNVILASARILPWKAVVVPKVAELPTCHQTLQPVPLFMVVTDEPLAVVSVLPI